MEKKMQRLQKTIQEVVSLGYEKAIRKGQRKVAVFIPLPFIPPCRPYKAEVAEIKIGQKTLKVMLFVEAAPQGGWIVRMQFPAEILSFNPVLDPEVGKKLLEKLQK